MDIKTRDVIFKVNDRLKPNMWYQSFKDKGLDTWEPYSYNILDMFKNKEDGIFLDIGAWIGPLTLYAAHKYKEVVSIEADPVASIALKANIKSNNFQNIQVIDKAISNVDDETVKFGGNGSLGNSESTLLVNDDNYNEITEKYTSVTKNTHTDIVNVQTVTLDTIINNTQIDVNKLALIKIDIEGSEKIVLPHIKDFLISCDAPLYLSLHPAFLGKDDLTNLVNLIYSIYKNGYNVTCDSEKTDITKEVLLQEVEDFYKIEDFSKVKPNDPGTRYFELFLEK